jgi:pimeloyl-ACP methyl ester carboxylesterase
MPYVKSGNINIYYEEIGTGFPLVLLMGLGTDHTGWDKHVVDFKKHFRCILVDNRGTGKSDKPEGPYKSYEMARDVIAVMDSLSIEKAYVNGCSMGGTIAQELYFAAPERVEKIVLTASFSYLDRYTFRILECFKTLYSKLLAKEAQKVINMFCFSRDYFNNNLYELEENEDLISEESKVTAYAYCAQVDAIQAFDSKERIKKISCPCLVIDGDKDSFVDIEQIKWMKDILQNSKLIVFKGKGHTFHLEEPKKYNTEVIKFLNNV